MNYEDILQRIQQDEKNELRTDIYRYNGILEAIRFYANRLTYEQITDAAFDFVNELLTVNKSVMYLLSGDHYRLAKIRGISNAPEELPMTSQLSGFALYVGNVLNGRKNLESYFSAETMDALDATVMVPLILEDKLVGFFLLSGRVSADFNESDIFVCEALMNLFNNALEGCERLERLQAANKELDEKIFNLFAINQSAKAMLTEHRLEELYSLAVDVFSELTSSSNTGFFLYDDASEKYVLKAYRDVYHVDKPHPVSLALKPDAQINGAKQIVDMASASDMQYFSSIFEEGTSPLDDVKAKYVVFIYGKHGKILGFVTLGATVSGAVYKKSAFELVDSLASYTYIALTNAILLKIVNDQKRLLEIKLERLMTLNTLIKNINSSETSDRLIELALETLIVSFGVESGLIALFDEQSSLFTVRSASDASLNGMTIPLNDKLQPLMTGKVLFESDSTLVAEYVGKEMADAIPNKAGVILVPITLERYEMHLIGVVIIFRTREDLLSNEENILTYETISNHMSPLIDGFLALERRKREYKLDVANLFSNELRAQIDECVQYSFDLEVVRVTQKNVSPFDRNGSADILNELFSSVYEVAYDRVYVVIQNDFDYNFRHICDALAGQDVDIARYRLFRDFRSFDEFVSLQR
jgi:transcriptional regulator with GAF, ATPase, and Fis domain